jgi:hypothetical protein
MVIPRYPAVGFEIFGALSVRSFGICPVLALTAGVLHVTSKLALYVFF